MAGGTEVYHWTELSGEYMTLFRADFLDFVSHLIIKRWKIVHPCTSLKEKGEKIAFLNKIQDAFTYTKPFNLLSDDEPLDWSKLKQIADDVLNCV